MNLFVLRQVIANKFYIKMGFFEFFQESLFAIRPCIFSDLWYKTSLLIDQFFWNLEVNYLKSIDDFFLPLLHIGHFYRKTN